MKFLQTSVLILGLAVFVNSQTTNEAFLSGSVYDANGSLIVDAKVTAINEKGEKFETVTNDEGLYVLNLPFNPYNSKADFKIAKYEITITKEGFERNFVKDFKFVPSFEKKMNLDIALDVCNPNCGVAGCLPDLQPVKSSDLKISDKILQRPLEELPKEQNKTKRKNKINKQ